MSSGANPLNQSGRPHSGPVPLCSGAARSSLSQVLAGVALVQPVYSVPIVLRRGRHRYDWIRRPAPQTRTAPPRPANAWLAVVAAFAGVAAIHVLAGVLTPTLGCLADNAVWILERFL